MWRLALKRAVAVTLALLVLTAAATLTLTGAEPEPPPERYDADDSGIIGWAELGQARRGLLRCEV